MNITVEHRPENGDYPWFLVTVRGGRTISDGGYATRAEAEAARAEFVAALRASFA